MSNFQNNVWNFTASSESTGVGGAFVTDQDAMLAREDGEKNGAEILKAAARKVQKALGMIIGLNFLGVFLLLGMTSGSNIAPGDVQFFLAFNAILVAIRVVLIFLASKSPVNAARAGFVLEGLIFLSNLADGVVMGIVPVVIMFLVMRQASSDMKM